MKVVELKEILKDSGCVVRESSCPVLLDPFVLYERHVRLEIKYFRGPDDIKAFFKGKKLVAMDCKDSPQIQFPSCWRRIRFYVHDPSVPPAKAPKGTFRNDSHV